MARVNYELAKLAEECLAPPELADALRQLYRTLGYSRFNPPSSVESLIRNGLPMSITGLEAMKGRRLINIAELTPMLFVMNSSREETNGARRQVLRANPDGLVYFAYFEGLEDLL